MNPIIKAQLEKCRVANIPEFDDTTTHLAIPQGSEMTVTPYQVNKCYLIELASYITNPPADFTLADNWNNGRIPTASFYNAQITNIMGKMVRFIGCVYDPVTKQSTNEMWEGWVPQKGIKLIAEL